MTGSLPPGGLRIKACLHCPSHRVFPRLQLDGVHSTMKAARPVYLQRDLGLLESCSVWLQSTSPGRVTHCGHHGGG